MKRNKRNVMTRGLASLMVCLLVLATGAGVVWWAWAAHAKAVQAARRELAASVSEKVVNVSVQVLEGTTIEDRLVLTGAVAPWEVVQLSAEVGGKVEWQGVDEGDVVSAGQELVRVDTEAIRVQLDQARAEHSLAVQELDRLRNLRRAGVSSPQEVDRATTQRDVASATVRALDIQLAKSVLKAPLDGVVDALTKEAAEFVDRGESLVRLVQVHKVKVEVGIPERDVPFFKKGDRVTVRVDALPDREFAGTVYRIATTADLRTRTFGAEIEVDNVEGVLKPGMIARARLIRHAYPDAVSAPIFSVIAIENRYIVYVEEEGLAQARDVEVGIFQDNLVHIRKGLSPGDRLIVAGQRSVRPGDRVRVVEAAAE